MPDQYAPIRRVQEFSGLGAKPIFWFFNTLWGVDLATRLPAIIFSLGNQKMKFWANLFAAIKRPFSVYSKWLIEEPCSFYMRDEFTPFKVSNGFRIPSNNALGITTSMVTISSYALRRWLWILSAILTFFVELVRVYYGVHIPSQVLLGWLAGTAIALALVNKCETICSLVSCMLACVSTRVRSNSRFNGDAFGRKYRSRGVA